MLRLTGQCLRVERKPWDIDGRHGVTVTARVLVGTADFVDVKVPETINPPAEGQPCDLAVVVLSKQRGGFDIKAVGPWAVPSPSAAAKSA